jgi:hypothetical protein
MSRDENPGTLSELRSSKSCDAHAALREVLFDSSNIFIA